MTRATRFTIIAASLLLCVGGILIANSSRQDISNTGTRSESIDAVTGDPGYQFAASSARPKLTFQQLETIIRRDPTAKSQSGRIEFGSVRMEEGTALAEVVFVSNDGQRVMPFLYKLSPERNSWKIVNVQRMWYVPRSHLLRGVRA
jgi:hypothetical protein